LGIDLGGFAVQGIAAEGGNESRTAGSIGAVGDIPALIAWWNLLLPSIGLSSPQAANGGGPKGQALQTDDGEQIIEPAIGAHNKPAAASPALRREGKIFAGFARDVKTTKAHFD
jgi:hypothetical protein